MHIAAEDRATFGPRNMNRLVVDLHSAPGIVGSIAQSVGNSSQ